MKTVIFLVLAVFSLNTAKSQNIDSLKQVILKLETSVNRINTNMERHHKQHLQGVAYFSVGVIASVLYAWKADQGEKIPALAIAGGSFITLGGVMMIDSHKWLGGRASRRK